MFTHLNYIGRREMQIHPAVKTAFSSKIG